MGKNILIFIPILLAHKFSTESIMASVLAFFSFCLLASAVYIFNDLFDLENDQSHSQKKNRPIASGHLSIPHACIIGFIFFTSSFFISAFLPLKFTIILIIYLILNLLYTLVFKTFPFMTFAYLASFT